jgi:Domain of unknown function (DUF5680)
MPSGHVVALLLRRPVVASRCQDLDIRPILRVTGFCGRYRGGLQSGGMVRLVDLEAFVVHAKASTYVGNGSTADSSRLGSHDLTFQSDEWLYRDSYFGGTDFLGQETVWFRAEPVWAENYYGYILRPDLIDAARAGATIKDALSAMYQEGRFLGSFDWTGPHGHYQDHSSGDVSHFHGREVILVSGVEAYALDYFGGLIKA